MGKMRDPDIKGMVFGKLTARERIGVSEFGQPLWIFDCICGGERVLPYQRVKKGYPTSCGCITNGYTGTHNLHTTPFYRVWSAMKNRCDPKHKDSKLKKFRNYAAKGILVCDRWMKFENFYEDMFPTYKWGLTLERKDATGNYNSENCTWATYKQQNNNLSSNTNIEYNGEVKSIAVWARQFDLSHSALSNRLQAGWTVEEALTIRPSKKNSLKRKGSHN